MDTAGVQRLITVTGFGVGDGRHRIYPLQHIAFDILLGCAYADKDILEDIIKSSTLNWTIVQAGILLPGETMGSAPGC